MDVNSLSHTKWNCKYHIVFAPKFRRKIIYGRLKRDIANILSMLCKRNGVKIVEAEMCSDHVHSLEELNRRWKIFLEQDYQKEAHDGIREYYKSYGVTIPSGGISPLQEWNRDTRGLVFLDTAVVSEAFLHHETRKLDNAGCFSFGEVRYEASAALANAEVEIVYEPMNTEIIKVLYQDMEPIRAHQVKIGAFCDKKSQVPVAMTDKLLETSRFLDALEKRYKEEHQLMANALSFGDYGKAGGSHV